MLCDVPLPDVNSWLVTFGFHLHNAIPGFPVPKFDLTEPSYELVKSQQWDDVPVRAEKAKLGGGGGCPTWVLFPRIPSDRACEAGTKSSFPISDSLREENTFLLSKLGARATGCSLLLAMLMKARKDIIKR